MRVLCTHTYGEVVNGMWEFIGDVEHDSIAESKPDIQSMGEPYESVENSVPSVILIRNICFQSDLLLFYIHAIAELMPRFK